MVETGFEHIWFHFSSNSDSNHGPSLMLKIAQLQAPYSLFPPSAWVPVGKRRSGSPGGPQWPAGDACCQWECVGEPQTDLASGEPLWRRWVLVWELKDRGKDRCPLLGQAVWFLFCLVCVSSFSSIAFFFPNLFLFSGLRTQSLKEVLMPCYCGVACSGDSEPTSRLWGLSRS